ncbi:hypothetical protein ACSBR2_002348 [Camellia fascicularis]
MRAAVDVRYIYFPMCYKSHWTLVVYNMENGVWKHYNSLRPRNNSIDIHYKEAMVLRDHVVTYVRRTRQASTHGDVVDTQEGDGLVESIVDCPQQ